MNTKLLKAIKEKEQNDDLYWRALQGRICPNCTEPLQKIHIPLGFFSNGKIGKQCNNCSFTTVKEYSRQ